MYHTSHIAEFARGNSRSKAADIFHFIFCLLVCFVGLFTSSPMKGQGTHRDSSFAVYGRFALENGNSLPQRADLGGGITFVTPGASGGNSNCGIASFEGGKWLFVDALNNYANSAARMAIIRVSRQLPNGTTDTSFDIDGSSIVHIPWPSEAAQVDVYPLSAFVQPNGKIIVVCNTMVYGTFCCSGANPVSGLSRAKPLVFRLNADGSPDGTFGSGGYTHMMVAPSQNPFSTYTMTNIVVNSASMGSQGNIYLGGYNPAGGEYVGGIFTTVTATPQLYRLNNNGTLDATWNNVGALTTIPTSGSAGSSYVGVTSVVEHNGSVFAGVMRFNTATQGGGYDAQGNWVPLTTYNSPQGILKLDMTGQIQSSYGEAGNGIASNADKCPIRLYLHQNQLYAIYKDFTTSAVPSTTLNYIWANALTMGWQIAGGGGEAPLFISKLLESGAVDPTFGASGYAAIEQGSSARLTFSGSGKIYYAISTDGEPPSIHALTASGAVDVTFGNNGIFQAPASLNNSSILCLNANAGDIAVWGSDLYVSPNLPSTCPSSGQPGVFRSQLFHLSYAGVVDPTIGAAMVPNPLSSMGNPLSELFSVQDNAGNERLMTRHNQLYTITRELLTLSGDGSVLGNHPVDAVLNADYYADIYDCDPSTFFKRIYHVNSDHIFATGADGRLGVFDWEFEPILVFDPAPIYALLPEAQEDFSIKEYQGSYYIFSTYTNNGTNLAVFKYTSDLLLDAAFGDQGVSINLLGSDFQNFVGQLIRPDGIYMLGWRNSYMAGQDKVFLTKLLPNGTMDVAYGDFGNAVIVTAPDLELLEHVQATDDWIYFFARYDNTAEGWGGAYRLCRSSIVVPQIDTDWGVGGFIDFPSRDAFKSPLFEPNGERLYYIDATMELNNTSMTPCTDCTVNIHRMILDGTIEEWNVEEVVYSSGTSRHSFEAISEDVSSLASAVAYAGFSKLKLDHSSEKLYAYGGGNATIFRYCLADATCPSTGGTGLESAGAANTPFLEVYPNPVAEMGIVRSDIGAGTIHLAIHDPQGRLSKFVTLQTTNSGGQFEFDASGLASGLYHIVVHQNDRRYAARFMKL